MLRTAPTTLPPQPIPSTAFRLRERVLARPGRAATPPRPERDWSAVRTGFGEVFLTVAATLAVGFAWAAIELERLGPPPRALVVAASAAGAGGEPVAALEKGYAAARAIRR